MRITVKGKNIEVTDALQRYAEKKVEKLGRYFENIKSAVVTQSTQRNWHIVEVSLEADGMILRGEERSDNMYASIDAVVENVIGDLRPRPIAVPRGILRDGIPEAPLAVSHGDDILPPIAVDIRGRHVMDLAADA